MGSILLISSGNRASGWVWGVAVAVMIWGLVAAGQGKTDPPPNKAPGNQGDVRMYEAVTNRVAAGEPYYRVVATELPARGYAIRPIFNWRLPFLTLINSISPSPVWGRVGLWALALAVIGLWTVVAGRHLPRVTVAAALVVATSTVAIVQAHYVVYLHEVWAGFLIAASLASWGLGRVGLAALFGLGAILIRELALPYVVMMAVLAIRDSNKREAYGWLAAFGIFLVVWSWHTMQAADAMPADGLRNAWLVTGGWPFVLSASRSSVFLMFLPAWLLALVVPLAWAGAWHWNNPTGRRVAAVLTGYFLLFMVIGRADNWYWGFLIAPLIPIGFFGYFFDPARTRA